MQIGSGDFFNDLVANFNDSPQFDFNTSIACSIEQVLNNPNMTEYDSLKVFELYLEEYAFFEIFDSEIDAELKLKWIDFKNVVVELLKKLEYFPGFLFFCDEGTENLFEKLLPHKFLRPTLFFIINRLIYGKAIELLINSLRIDFYIDNKEKFYLDESDIEILNMLKMRISSRNKVDNLFKPFIPEPSLNQSVLNDPVRPLSAAEELKELNSLFPEPLLQKFKSKPLLRPAIREIYLNRYTQINNIETEDDFLVAFGFYSFDSEYFNFSSSISNELMDKWIRFQAYLFESLKKCLNNPYILNLRFENGLLFDKLIQHRFLRPILFSILLRMNCAQTLEFRISNQTYYKNSTALFDKNLDFSEITFFNYLFMFWVLCYGDLKEHKYRDGPIVNQATLNGHYTKLNNLLSQMYPIEIDLVLSSPKVQLTQTYPQFEHPFIQPKISRQTGKLKEGVKTVTTPIGSKVVGATAKKRKRRVIKNSLNQPKCNAQSRMQNEGISKKPKTKVIGRKEEDFKEKYGNVLKKHKYSIKQLEELLSKIKLEQEQKPDQLLEWKIQVLEIKIECKKNYDKSPPSH